MNKFALRSVTAMAVLGLSLGMGAAGAVAEIAGGTGTQAPVASSSTIDFSKSGSITVHKSVADPVEGQNTGNPLDPAPSPGLPGVTFELYLIQEINSAADFSTAVEYGKDKTESIKKPAGLAPYKTGVTDAMGVVTFGDLPLGLYLVVEAEAPTEVTTKAENFLVYLPMTNPDGLAAWNYNVHAYPKNQVELGETTVEKEVEDSDQNVGDTIKYTITSSLPSTAVTPISKYWIEDDLDEANVFTTKDQVNVSLSNGVELEKDKDYTVHLEESTQKVRIEFEDTGLAKLNQAPADTKVITTIEAEVKEVGETDGVAKNEAKVIHNNPKTGDDVETESNEVTTYWAKLRIFKQDEAGKGLKDAEFDLFRCEAEAEDSTPTLGQQLFPGTQLKSDANGNIVIDGLHVTDYENNAITDPDNKAYCLVETKAPEGYELQPTPIVIKLNTGDLVKMDGDAYEVSYLAKVTNLPETNPGLPITGGMGVGLLAGLGGIIVAGGAVAAKRAGSKA